MDGPITPTKTYRLFRLDGAGHIRAAARIIEAANDATAIVQAVAMVNGESGELWDGTRLVHSFKVPRGPEPPDR